MIYTDFALCMNAMCIHTLMKQIQITAIISKKGSMVDSARCSLVVDAIQTGATHILFLDSDHTFPRDLLERMIRSDKDIVGIHQVTKRPPIRSNCEDMQGNRLTAPGAGLQEVTRIGTGIILIKLAVFNNMKLPYFEYRFDKGMFKTPHWIGEDYYFCEAARHKGYKIFVDHDLSKECYHIGTAMYGLEELERTNGTKDINR